MKQIGCNEVRDLLPEYERDALPAAERLAVGAHLSGCAACRAEAELVALVRTGAAAIVPPAGLEARVLKAARTPGSRRRWMPANLAIAASIVLALVTGGLLLRDGDGGPTGEPADAGSLVGIAGPAAREPLLRGVPSLDELSEEELEHLLSELGS